MDENRVGWPVGVQEVNLDLHIFKCASCKQKTAHILVKVYSGIKLDEVPGEVWEVECQRCFEPRIIYPSERIAAKEDDICRCDQCGNWKLKTPKCRICQMVADNEAIKEKYWTGSQTLERDA